MRTLAFKQVDVFTRIRFQGNPVAVVFDADGLSSRQMQAIANWTNLSETTFVLPVTVPGADYRLRIFTPGAELPFAGHPTLGTAHALLEAGLVTPRDGALVQQCEAGLVSLTVDRQEGVGGVGGVGNEEGAGGAGQTIAFDLPPADITVLDDGERDALEAILGTESDRRFPPARVEVGARWIIVRLPDARAVLACRPDLQRMAAHDEAAGTTGVVIFGGHDAGAAARIEVRAFAPAHGVNEDPVCGSGNGAIAAYLRHTGQVADFGHDYTASQGAVVGRAGLIHLSIDDRRIRVGGAAVTCIDGTLTV